MEQDTALKIARRREFVNHQVEKLRRDLDVLLAELAELEVAERVYKRFGGEPMVAASVLKPPISPSVSALGALFTAVQGGQDDNDGDSAGPTLPEMVFLILDEAKAEGRKGVDSSEMLRTIQARWKPDFTADKVRPTLWRMVQKKRLRKRGRLYFRPEEAEAAVAPHELARQH